LRKWGREGERGAAGQSARALPIQPPNDPSDLWAVVEVDMLRDESGLIDPDKAGVEP
jgi:hypothetical protein